MTDPSSAASFFESLSKAHMWTHFQYSWRYLISPGKIFNDNRKLNWNRAMATHARTLYETCAVWSRLGMRERFTKHAQYKACHAGMRERFTKHAQYKDGQACENALHSTTHAQYGASQACENTLQHMRSMEPARHARTLYILQHMLSMKPARHARTLYILQHMCSMEPARHARTLYNTCSVWSQALSEV